MDQIEIDWEENISEVENDEEELEDESEDSDEKPFDADRIRVDAKPISVHQMVQMIDANEGGQINLNPDFQRRKVWKERKRKSLLIESLMLRIPLPVFYVYEDENSVWNVVDGLQRMSTIYDFIKGKFKLSGLEYLKNSNGKSFSELDQKYRNRISTTTLTINVVDSLTPAQVKFDIFRRINTGGVPLNPQEIRNSTANQKTRKFIRELVELESFKKATNNMNDLRMEAQELVLRFIAFYYNYDIKTNEINYKKGMDTFLDKAYDQLNKTPAVELQKLKRAFDNSMKNAFFFFGKYAFRRVTQSDLKSDAKLKPINKSLFTCTSVVLAHLDHEKLNKSNGNNQILLNLARELSKDSKFNESLSKGTGDPSRIKVQFSTLKKFFSDVISIAKES